MGIQVVAERVRELRRRRNKLSREDLAAKAKCSPKVVERMETGWEPGFKETTIMSVARALDVEPSVLTGEAAMPADEGFQSALFPETSLTLRMPTSAVNAAYLVARRYKVPVRRIFELAPLSFDLNARQSLAQRSSRLEQLRAADHARWALREDLLHLPRSAVANAEVENAIEAEAASIAQLDLFGDVVLDHASLEHESWDDSFDEDTHNPLACFFRDQSIKLDAGVDVETVSRVTTRYRLGRDAALDLACGDEELAGDITSGAISLRAMPSDLWKAASAESRLAWLRQRAAEHASQLRTEMGGDLDLSDVLGDREHETGGEQARPEGET